MSFSDQDLYRVNYEDPMEGLWCTGLTASGFEQSAGAGRNGNFPVPTTDAIDYFHDEGANCFRVPILWERLQSWSNVGSPELDPVDGFLETIKYITEDLGDYAIVVPYKGAFGGLRLEDGDGIEYEATMEDFIGLWAAISKQFAGNDRVVFELYNFPEYGSHNGQDGDGVGYFAGGNVGNDDEGTFVEAWAEWCQGALDAIRAQGANNYVLVPGLRASSCRDWSGAQYWGPSLDGQTKTGNLRLFALNDTALRTAYAVHQFFDSTLTGNQHTGCSGHDAHVGGGYSADEGCLTHTVEMARKYNKKLWLTETGSFLAENREDSPVCDYCQGEIEWDFCEAKMDNFLARMAVSEVFLGYQVWQFGDVDGGDSAEHEDITIQDQWDRMPYNLEWYDFEKYGITTTTTTSTTITKTTSTATTSTSTRTTSTSTTATTSTSTLTSSTSTVTTGQEIESDASISMSPGAGLAAAGVLAFLSCYVPTLRASLW